jgi:glycosyltransferase involved in cell wall biosynthesis
MKNRIKVLHVGYGGRGGAARVLIDVATRHSPDFDSSVILLGYNIDEDYIIELKNHKIPGFAVLKQSRVDYGFLLRLRKTISNIKPDVIFFHTPVAYLWGRLPFVTNKKNTRIVAVEHLASTGYGPLSSIWNLLLSLRTDMIICVSEGVRNYLKKNGFPLRKLVVIENGISVKPCQERDLLNGDIINISMVSRLSPPKDHATLLKAFAIIINKGYAAVLNLVGDGSLKDRLVHLSKDLGISNNVNFLGERKNVRSMLLETDLFVLSTHNEGLPIAVLEAMEAGCPVIATAIPTISGIIQPGINGLLVPKNDAYALADAIMQLVDDPGKASEMARKGRDLIESRYCITNTVRQYEKLCMDILNINCGSDIC